MRVTTINDEKPCEVVEGEFVFGAQTCGALTKFVEIDSGDNHPVCLTHITASRRDLDDRTEGSDGAPLSLALDTRPAPRVTASPLDLARALRKPNATEGDQP